MTPPRHPRPYGLSRTTAGHLFPLYFLVNGGAQPLIGALSDRYSRDGAAAMATSAGLIGFAVLVSGSGIAAASATSASR